MTVRTRLLLASLATLVTGIAFLLILGNVLLHHQVGQQTRDLLRERASAQLAAVKVVNGRIRVVESANDGVLDRQAWVLQGARVIERPATASADLDHLAVALGQRQETTQRSAGHDVELRSEPVRAGDNGPIVGSVVVAISLASVERLEQLVLVGSLIFAALVVLAGTVAIRSALDGALRPVSQMTEQAEAWGAHDLDSRFDLGPPRDELSSLAATLDHLLARIAASRRHEQRFAGEVAHELRTPVAGIRGRAELALSPDATDAERRQALAAVVEQTAELTGTIDTLLAIARREIDPTSGTVDLEALAREVDGVTVRVDRPVPRAEGEADIVRRALAPLLDNAHRYAKEVVALELTADEHAVRLAVVDDGPGVPPGLADHVFEPGVRGEANGEGAGLGLALARRLARSCGGDVVVEPGDVGRFVLELPAVSD